MAKPKPKILLAAAAGYLKQHPEELMRAVRGALGLRLAVPLDALRYLARELPKGKKAPQDVVIEAVPPGLRLGATFAVMGSRLRARLTLYFEGLDVSATQALVTARIADVELEVVEGDSPIAGLLKSGALDLSKPGNLLAFLPNRPPLIVDAKDDRIVLDILKAPRLAERTGLKKALAVVTPVFNVASIRSRDDHLEVQFRASPERLTDSLAAARA